MRYDRATLIAVLTYHQRRDIEGCICGWAVLGASHPAHVVDVYEQAMTLDQVGTPYPTSPGTTS